MLRRAIQRARLHLPAPIGHDNGLGASPSDDEECPWSPSVSYTSLKDDDAVRDHFRTLPEDVTNLEETSPDDAQGNEPLEPFEGGETAPQSERRRQQDDGLRSLLQTSQLPSGVVLRDVQKLSVVDENNHMPMPQGFTADMFEALGNKIYNDMIEAGEQSQISPAALEILGNCLYAEAETLAVSAAA
ncbi:hypothetical protein BBO99_00004766 [Phytophthora kernoviae]|uniref:Uncharacterized protein n=2 Tax=Phytophthora kernoviae TaxID=325452 RepID=A0A3R7HIS0_9STRA|nr:hypothetical protein G195_008599 [Phytophthora kernoviae 00238/432]KAG2522776.1 hypothetical protein JM16_004480 [Phytophthora kernoviae]KAG2524415.1 hypothetical protein JM18_005378 [Phytophthora kernoviae]RLN10898.1 hypothetical protein BBI17_004865 [Phytophthora kernoviae]RLN80077.1 hypothetical protein BBO99_00004766 [Phytophthora kernoviae]